MEREAAPDYSTMAARVVAALAPALHLGFEVSDCSYDVTLMQPK